MNQETIDKIEAALSLINGLRRGFCPCGYMGCIVNGKCWKCGTEWGIGPLPPKPYYKRDHTFTPWQADHKICGLCGEPHQNAKDSA